MGALRQPRLTEPRKPVGSERRDKYGRDPGSLPEKLRARTDYDAGTGWAPSFFGLWADLPRLSSGAVCYAFIGIVQQLSFGRPRAKGAGWQDWTEPITAADLAELCYCNVRDIQRQLAELKERGMIAVKTSKQGSAVYYSISLLLSKWRSLEDYGLWKRRQVVAIDEGAEDETAEDEAPAEISKEAVPLVKRPVKVSPGRASRAVPVKVGVSSFSFQNDSRVDCSFSGVITSGRLVVMVSAAAGATLKNGETKSKGQAKSTGYDQTRDMGVASSFPRASEIVALFDPFLIRDGRRLLAGDAVALAAACAAVGDCPSQFLSEFVASRAERSINSPLHVQAICTEALKAWRASLLPSSSRAAPAGKKRGFTERLEAEAIRRLKAYGEI